MYKLTFALPYLLSIIFFTSSSVLGDDNKNQPKDFDHYKKAYDFITYLDTFYTFLTEFSLPDGYHYLQSDKLNSYQKWISEFPLQHRFMSLGNWKGAKVFERDSVSRGVDIPWQGNVYQEQNFPLRFLAEFMRYNKTDLHLTYQPEKGEPISYRAYLKGKVARNAKGEVIVIPGEERPPSLVDFYRYTHYIMKLNTFKLLAGNCELIKEKDIRPGDMFISHDERGRKGTAVLILNVIENKKGKRLYAVGRGCTDACDFHIPKINQDRHNPWITIEQINKLEPIFESLGFYRFLNFKEIKN